MASPWTVGLGFLFLGAVSWAQDSLVRDTEALSPEDELAAFTVAEGFEIRLFASEPMVNKPINLAIDSRGRIWVSSTVEYPYAASKDRWEDAEGSRVRDSRDAIKILEDRDGDGRADRVTDFADGLNIPTGVLPWRRDGHAEGCIAWSIPNLWYFADTDGDGRADHREVLFGPLGYEKDTHGMVSNLRLGADGWVYATHGFNNTSVLRAKDGSEIELHSGNVFRFRPDGSRVEVWSRGQVNPFGLAFDRRGNLYSADCHSAPVYQLLRGAVYPSFGKPHDGLGFGPAMIEHSHGSTGIAGIVYVDRGLWGGDWDDHVLIGNPVTSRVNLDRIDFVGSTPRAEEKPDFLVSRDPWFRPVDLALAPDGSLYIADFYNRIIGHYEVPLDHPGRDRERGRLWKVTKTGPRPEPASPEPIPRPSDPVAALEDPSPWTRRAAAGALLDRPSIAAIAPLRRALGETPAGDTHLRHALRLALRACLSLPEAYASMGTADAEIASISLAVPSPGAATWLLGFHGSDGLPRDFPELRRRHIARHGDPAAIAGLLEEETAAASDRDVVEHSHAILDVAGVLQERHGVLRDPAVLAEVTRLASDWLDRPTGQGASTWLVREGDPRAWELQQRETDTDEPIEVISSLSRAVKSPEQNTGRLVSRPFSMPERLAFRLCGHLGPPGKEANGKSFVLLADASDGRELARVLPPRNDRAARVEWRFPEFVGRRVRLEVVDGDGGSAYAWLGIGAVEGVALPAADFGAEARREELLRRFARLLATAAPVGLRDRLAPWMPTPPAVPPLELPPAERERLARLVAERVAAFDPKAVDKRRGQALFGTHCAACHRIAGEGGLIGPQLDGIGKRGLERLAEDILDPNRNVDAHFRLVRIEKRDGSELGGFVASEEAQWLTLLDPAGQSHRIRKAEIASREDSAVSLMPGSFGELLGPEGFGDLAAWLLDSE